MQETAVNSTIGVFPSSEARDAPILTRHALRKRGVRLLDAGDQTEAVVGCGVVGKVRMDCGVYANFGRRMQLEDLEMELELDARICINIFLEGYVEASLNGTPLPMPKRTAKGRWQSSAVIVSNEKGARLRRRARKGQYLDKMVIGMSREWLKRWEGDREISPGFRALINGAPGFWQWNPGPKVEFLARQMFDVAARKPPFAGLLLENNTLAIIAEALTATFSNRGETVVQSSNLTVLEQQRLYALIQYIDRHSAHDHPSAAEVAGALSMSQATLQRLVRKGHHCSLSEFIRYRWLDEAHEALLFSNHSISDIAFDAGYIHLSNFTTAFRKRFGYPPSSLRKQATPPAS
ncbi:helix-turn-helix domain-containing protein [Brucella sp. 09RB8918]|nr:helix-turn-helix domain-containing protein [Brucella sp. 09RB8913]MRN60326.1 helix-turn-helix domain-containing protein [Brucella sp. 09RB8918]